MTNVTSKTRLQNFCLLSTEFRKLTGDCQDLRRCRFVFRQSKVNNIFYKSKTRNCAILNFLCWVLRPCWFFRNIYRWAVNKSVMSERNYRFNIEYTGSFVSWLIAKYDMWITEIVPFHPLWVIFENRVIRFRSISKDKPSGPLADVNFLRKKLLGWC